MTLTLFPSCVLPGCTTPVVHVGEPCDRCLDAFGPMLRPTDQPALTAEQIAHRDAQVHNAYQQHTQPPPAPGPERKAMQLCWLCEQRRTCTRQPAGWECDQCQEVQ